jgi:hypothetical protein
MCVKEFHATPGMVWGWNEGVSATTVWLMGGLLIVTGLVAAGVGIAVASHRLRMARRSYHRTALLSAASPEGWGSWFLGGFSGVTMGIRWLYAVASWLAWTLAGVCLIGLGLRLFGR